MSGLRAGDEAGLLPRFWIGWALVPFTEVWNTGSGMDLGERVQPMTGVNLRCQWVIPEQLY